MTSPGPLSASHAALDNQGGCFECHTDDQGGHANVKCLGCHDHHDLRVRITQARGFHASPPVRDKECRVCHREHKGRGFDPMGWNTMPGGMAGFDHALTGWPLTGKHATSCDRCHTAKNKQGLATFLGVDTRCSSCHARQPHGFTDPSKPISRCERCHGDAAWRPALPALQFDHEDRQDAAFGLAADHAGVACAKCHPGGLFDLPAFDCVTCHPKGTPKKRPR